MSMINVEVKWVIWEINERGEAESLIENDPFCWVINLPSTMNVETDLFFDNLVPKSGRIVEEIITLNFVVEYYSLSFDVNRMLKPRPSGSALTGK